MMYNILVNIEEDINEEYKTAGENGYLRNTTKKIENNVNYKQHKHRGQIAETIILNHR